MLSCFVDGIAYCAISVGKNIELYHVKNHDTRVLVATFQINEDLTYFEISAGCVFINKYICNPATGTFRPHKGKFPKSMHQVVKVKVTFRSKLAVLTDYNFIGAPFDEIKLKNVPLNINYSVDGFTVTEAFWGTKFIGNSDEFLGDKLGGSLSRMDLTDCWRNHVYREYDYNIASCETCNTTKCTGMATQRSSAIKPTTRVIFTIGDPAQTINLLFGRDKDDAMLLLFTNYKLYKVYLGNKDGKFVELKKFYDKNI